MNFKTLKLDTPKANVLNIKKILKEENDKINKAEELGDNLNVKLIRDQIKLHFTFWRMKYHLQTYLTLNLGNRDTMKCAN